MQLAYCYKCKHLTWLRGEYHCTQNFPSYLCTYDGVQTDEPQRNPTKGCFEKASPYEYMRAIEVNMPKKRFVPYAEYGGLLNEMVRGIKNLNSNFTAVLGIPRGGLPIAVHLSHYFDVPLIDAIDSADVGKTILVVDDVNETGESLITALDNIHKWGTQVITAVMFNKPISKFKPDYFAEETRDWIIFPWECLDEIPNRPGY